MIRSMANLLDRYKAGMVLSGVGDALGYKNGHWEFCLSGVQIQMEVQELGGLEKIKVKSSKWIVSDDTVMHLATGEALVQSGNDPNMEALYANIARHYKKCVKDMAGRAPGPTCMSGVDRLRPDRVKGYQIPFNKRGGGCGAAMRAMCIGLRYPRPEDLEKLIAVSVESGRMTHHHPTGYLGALAGALFTAYSVQGKPPREWGKGLVSTLPQVLNYVKETGHCYEENRDAWSYFLSAWERYLELRQLTTGETDPVFPEKYGTYERDGFYKSISFGGWGGASGHDSSIIAYDAFLGADGNWSELCNRAMFHGGDSDSTGVMAACWYGVMYGYKDVPKNNYEKVEYRKRLEEVGEGLYNLASQSKAKSETQKADLKMQDNDQVKTTDQKKLSDSERQKADQETTSDADRQERLNPEREEVELAKPDEPEKTSDADKQKTNPEKQNAEPERSKASPVKVSSEL